MCADPARLTTDQKGAIAESAIAHAAIRLGIGVLKPLTDGHRYDLVFDHDGRLTRVQCKAAQLQADVVTIPCCSSRRSASGFVKRSYGSSEIDAIAAFCLDLERCFFVPIERVAGRKTLHLRLRPTRNNQRERVNWADDFALERLRSDSQGP